MSSRRERRDAARHRERERSQAEGSGRAGAMGVDIGRIARRVAVACVALELLFVVGDYIFDFSGLVTDLDVRRIFNPAREGSVPSWFSSSLLVAAGCVCLLSALLLRARGGRRLTWFGWSAIAAFFVFMGIDDAAMLHERIGSAVGRLMERRPDADSGVVGAMLEVPTYSWQVFVMPFFALAGIAMTVFLWKHLRRHALFAYAFFGMACFATAVGMDFVEGMAGVFAELAARWNVETYTVSHYSKVIEETLEMLGATSFLFGFMSYLGVVAEGTTLALTSGDRTTTAPTDADDTPPPPPQPAVWRTLSLELEEVPMPADVAEVGVPASSAGAARAPE